MRTFDLWSRWVSTTSRPILVGPWRSELGFEVLYFIPWLARWRKTYGIDRSRLIVLSRGGAGVWYDAGHSVELYDYLPPAEMRLQMLADFARQKSMKQLSPTRDDRALRHLVVARLGLRSSHWLHPSAMYQQLTPWWSGHWGLQTLLDRLYLTPLVVPPRSADLGLPDKYVVAKFYTRPTWPVREDLQVWTTDLLARLVKTVPVVLLHTGLTLDDHCDIGLDVPGVISLAGKFEVRDNLAVQSAVLAGARAYVGTYGGTMQLAARMGLPAMGFFHEFTSTAYAHKVLTEWLGTSQGRPVFIGRPGDADFVVKMVGSP